LQLHEHQLHLHHPSIQKKKEKLLTKGLYHAKEKTKGKDSRNHPTQKLLTK
ncbi:hypothetical protein MKX03_035683, partial [Papaver bracteatum]